MWSSLVSVESGGGCRRCNVHPRVQVPYQAIGLIAYSWHVSRWKCGPKHCSDCRSYLPHINDRNTRIEDAGHL